MMEQRFNCLKASPDAKEAMSELEPYLQRRGRGVRSRPMLVLAFLITSTLTIRSPLRAEETITPLMSHAVTEVPGKEVLMYTVDFPPGFSSPVHRHNAQVSVYMLEGSVVMQVKGGKEITLRPGQSFYESPEDIHVVSRNASNTDSAKFVVFLIKKKGTPLVIPAK
jgi:quercetin dioxygenase-like cupin family protein